MKRRLYAKFGASSLHEFRVRVLGYSEGAAHRRISAMRCMVSVPEVKEKLETGTLKLTTVKLLATNSLEAEEKKKIPKEMPTSLARSEANKTSRYIPAHLKRQIWMRDNDQCTYPGCQSRHRLEIDHCEPFSIGGKTELGNLRLLCKAHNAYQAIQTLGLPKMSQYLSSS